MHLSSAQHGNKIYRLRGNASRKTAYEFTEHFIRCLVFCKSDKRTILTLSVKIRWLDSSIMVASSMPAPKKRATILEEGNCMHTSSACYNHHNHVPYSSQWHGATFLVASGRVRLCRSTWCACALCRQSYGTLNMSICELIAGFLRFSPK